MGFTPDQPLTAGTVLIRSDIRSQNYVQGVSGWIIEADGDAEFNDLTVRGELFVTGENGSQVSIEKVSNNGSVQPFIFLTPGDPAGYGNYQPGFIDAQEAVPADPSKLMYLELQGPRWNDTTSRSPAIRLKSNNAALTIPQVIEMFGPVQILDTVGGGGDLALQGALTVQDDATVTGTITGGTVTAGTTLKVGTRDVGRGLVVRASSPADATGFTTTEIVLLSAASATYAANRAYRVVHNARYTNSAATANFPVLGFRKGTTTAGQALVDAGRFQMPASTLTFNLTGDFVFTTGANPVTTQISMTGVTTPAGVTVTQRGAATLGRYFEIYDIGEAADFPDTVVLV